MPIHISALDPIILRTDANGKKIAFNISFRKKNGVMVEAQRVTCSSTSGKRKTITIVFPNQEVRTIRRILVMRLNGERVFI